LIPILDKLEKYQDEMATATIVWHELLFGCQRLPISRQREKLEQYLYQTVTKLPLLPYTQEAAEWHAAERARLSLLGKTPPFADGQIAAIAKVNDLILVTANVSDYENRFILDLCFFRLNPINFEIFLSYAMPIHKFML